MKKLYFLVLLQILCFVFYGQHFEWAKAEGHYAYDYGYGIATDNAGNVYVAGKYEENAVFSGVTLPNQGNHDIYVARYSPTGELNWIHTAGATNGDYARTLACNKTNRVSIAGEIEGSPNPIVFPGSPITLTTQGDNDVFIATYDLDGNLLWAISEGNISNEKALGITYDHGGNVIICGYFTDSTRFGGVPVSGAGQEDMFVAKYDGNGNLQWMKHAGGPKHDEAKWVSCDASGNIYVCGIYSDGAVFGSTTFSTAVTQYGQFYDGFVAKYAPDGTLLWVKGIVGDYDDLAWSVTVDNIGKIYVAGEFSGAYFGNSIMWPYEKADAFVACYDQNGNNQWAVHAGGHVADRARGIGTDGSTIFVTGQFGLTGVFGTDTLIAADSADIFVSALDNTGHFLWTKAVGGPADAYEDRSYESGIAICAETSGNAYVTGSLLSGGDFGTGFLPGYSRSDMFIAKMTTGLVQSNASSGISLYPNPANGHFSVHCGKDMPANIPVNVYNCLGQVIRQRTLNFPGIDVDLSDEATGVYFVRIGTGKDATTTKILIE